MFPIAIYIHQTISRDAKSSFRRATSADSVSGRNLAYTFSVTSVLPWPSKRLTTDMESPLFSAKTANECLATCIDRVNRSPICSPTTAND